VHPVGKTLQSILRHHHYDQFEIFGYDLTKAKRDFLTLQILQMPNVHWRNNLFLESNLTIIQMILSDEIDILVDMLGHTDGGANRLEILAVKPAPAIVSYFAYPGTMGMTSIGYKFADKYTIPIDDTDLHKCYFEKIIRLSGGIGIYEPYDQAPLQTKHVEPYDKPNRTIRFCCLNNPQKFNTKVIETWANILLNVPNSMLYFRFFFFQNSLMRETTIVEFAKFGISEDRLNFGSATVYEYLELFTTCDIALDCFPYNGGMTSTESLFYGTPLITLEGTDYVSRVGVSLLSHLGYTELIAKTCFEYISIAVSLAKNPMQLKHYHETIPVKIKQIALGNGSLFIQHFEKGLYEIWQDTIFCLNNK
jgi:predicted O-linked N-acetylglucosamine transferase (SPINDLY family)